MNDNENSIKRLKSETSLPPSALSTLTTTNTPQWEKLSSLAAVVNYLPFEDVKKLSLVCKNWNKLTLSHRLESIETLSAQKSGRSKDGSIQRSEDAQADEYIQSIIKNSNLVKKLLINEQLVDSILTKLFTTFINLTDLHLYCFNISPTSLSSITSNCPNLERLTFESMTITNDSSNPIQLKFIQFPDNLRYLSFDGSSIDLESGIDENFLINHDNVSTFKCDFSDEQFLKPLAKSYPSLKHLHLKFNNSSPKTRHKICEILEHNPQISQLKYNDKPMDKTLDLIFHQMTQIEDLTFSAHWSSKFIIKTKTNQILKHLDLSEYRDNKIKVTKALLPNCPNLETLAIYIGYRRDQVMDLIADHCPNLTDLTLIEDCMEFPSRQPFNDWANQTVDADVIDREFQCANILKRLQLKNIMLTERGIKILQQFTILKEVRFAIETDEFEDEVLPEVIEEYLNDLPNTTLREDPYNDSLMGSIYLPNRH